MSIMNTNPTIELSNPSARPGSGGAPDEDAFAPLCAQIELFERAARFQGRPGERLMALGEAEEIYFRLYPHHYRALQTIRIASQLGKAGRSPQDPTVLCESRLLSIVTRVIKEAVTQGDLVCRQDQTPGELAFTLWALSFGTRALMDTRVAACQLGVEDGFHLSRKMTEVLLDALCWRPLLAEWDYTRTRERIRRELFSSEWAQVEARRCDPA